MTPLDDKLAQYRNRDLSQELNDRLVKSIAREGRRTSILLDVLDECLYATSLDEVKEIIRAGLKRFEDVR